MKFSLRLSRLAALVAAALPTAGLAQDALEETVITATRTPVPLDSVGAPVIVISRDDIERSLASDVSELLAQHAGLEIARNGGPGQTTSLFVRGTDSNHTIVLVDGVRVNPGTIGGAALQNIAPESLERIEIVKGPRSALYGSDAVGGVVQLFTRGADKNGASGGVTHGSHATQQVFGDAALSSERFKMGVGGSYSQSDGIAPRLINDSERGWRNVTGRLSAEFAASEALTFRGRAWRATGRTEYSESNGLPVVPPVYMGVSQDFETSVYSADAEYAGADGLRVRGTLSRMNDVIDQNEANFGGFDFAHTRRDNVDVQVDLPRLGSHLLSIGAQHADENVRALSFGTALDEDTRVVQGFLQDQFRLGRVISRLAAGFVDHETFGSEMTWNAEIGTAFGTGTRVTLSGGKAFRAPDATDRFGFGGNPELDPEVSRQVEITVRQKLGEHQQVSLSAFDNRIRDLINYFVIDPVTFDGENRNIDRARIKGAELGYEYANEDWRVRADLTLQDPRDESTDQRLLRRSRESLKVAVNRDVGPLDLGVDVAAYGNRKDFGFPSNSTLDSYTLVNATVRWRVAGDFTLQGRLENALDADYTLAQGYRTEGRTYTIGVRYSFD